MSASRLPSAVVDTNLVVSGLLNKEGSPGKLLAAFRARRFRLLLSDKQREELEDVFSREQLFARYDVSRAERDDFLELLDLTADAVPHATVVQLSSRDPKDEFLLSAAFAGEADYLVSGDNDLLELAGDQRLGKLRILTVGQFLDALANDPVKGMA